MSKVQYGILHNHTEHSVRDSAMSLKRLYDRAQELGAPAIALTDHGILTGILDFMKMGKEYGIKPIPGMEAYFIPDGKHDIGMKPRHLILMAKDLQGYQAICRAAYKSYQYISHNFPCMDMEILRDTFGPGTDGYGHVIATSACVNGVLAKILLEDADIEKSTARLLNQQAKYHPMDNEVNDAVFEEQSMADEIDALIKRRDELMEASKINLTGLKRKLKATKSDAPDYDAVQKEFDDATEAKANAKAELDEIKKTIAAKKKAKSAYSKSIAPMKQSVDRWLAVQEKIDEVLATKQGDEALYAKAKATLETLVEIFGKENFFVELQYHHVSDEKKVMPLLAQMADEAGVDVVAANDAHYATKNYEDVRARTLVAAMRFNKPIEEDVEGFGELYMRDDEELENALSQVVDLRTAMNAVKNVGKIVDACNVELSHENHYPVFPSENGETASERLRRLAEEGISKRYPGSTWTPEYEKRMNYELGVIDKMGYSDYLCIVQDYLDYGRKLGYDCPEGVGYTIGPGRGSAAGSIVCYLTGITSVDPMRYGLLFERFLNPERVSMPDIDADFAGEVRERVVEYVRQKYRSKDLKEQAESICSIITKGTMAAKGSIRNVARVTNIPLSLADEVAKKVPNEVHATIDDIPDLDAMCAQNPVVKQLIADAKLVEGTVVQYGIHAAGIIIPDNGDVGAYVPLYRNIDKGQAVGPYASQLDMVQCEADAGLLKMDFLGLRNLDIITDTLRRIKRNYGTAIDIEAIPEEPEVFANIFSTGNTDCVFQFESGGMKDMLRQFRPNSMEDLTLLNAAYRPGPMQYIPEVIKVKHGRAKPRYIADGLEEILSETYGYTIYQEQVMQIFNKIGGFSLGESDIIRRAMSKKKLAVLTDPKTNYQGKFIDGLKAHGASEHDAEELWEQMLDFASYAFNKSHALAYATIAYQTAWLKYHYPAEYMCSVMNWTGNQKLPQLVSECRNMSLQILPPDINRSKEAFTNEENAIIYGFSNIKNVGKTGLAIVAERTKNGAFVSVKDFVLRMIQSDSYNKSAMEVLVKSGAFDAFCDGNRASILMSIEEFVDTTKKMLQKQDKAAEAKKALDNANTSGASEADVKKAAKALERAEKSSEVARDLFTQHSFIMVAENKALKLRDEHELLGVYISGSPFDDYSEAASLVKSRSSAISVASEAPKIRVSVCGIVKDLRMLQRKSDGAHFCIFNLLDDSGEVEVKCFSKKYAEFGTMIADGAALTITGTTIKEQRYADDGTEIETDTAVNAESIQVLKRNANERIVITGTSVVDWQENYERIKAYESVDGCPAIFTDKVDLGIRDVAFPVSKDIVNAKLPGLTISLSHI